MTRLGAAVVDAVSRVAGRHGLAPRWLNDAAAGFRPGTFDITACELLLDAPSLRVLGAPIDQVFLMKLAASRAADTEDLIALWPRCSFESPEESAAALYAAYPHDEHDPHLTEYIRRLV